MLKKIVPDFFSLDVRGVNPRTSPNRPTFVRDSGGAFLRRRRVVVTVQ